MKANEAPAKLYIDSREHWMKSWTAFTTKAKRYDEAIKRVENIRTGKCETTFMFTEGLFEYIFPELKESEDERIRKEIIAFLTYYHTGQGNSVKYDDGWLAWLEKQGKNNMGISEATKQKLEDNLNKALEKETPESWNEFLQEGEQRPVIVPKFMVGDFIKLKDSDETYEVSKIEIFDTDEIYYHLTNGGCVGENADNFELVKQKPTFKVGDIISNGTSEVKIIEVNDNSYSVTNDEIENDCNLSNWVVYFKDQDNWKLVEQKPAWSEEDETKIKSIITFLKSPALCAMESNKGIIDASIKYLKSLKERYTWKPSKRVIQSIRDCVLNKNIDADTRLVLDALYQDLLKLRNK